MSDIELDEQEEVISGVDDEIRREDIESGIHGSSNFLEMPPSSALNQPVRHSSGSLIGDVANSTY
jgi:hypothetical protein